MDKAFEENKMTAYFEKRRKLKMLYTENESEKNESEKNESDEDSESSKMNEEKVKDISNNSSTIVKLGLGYTILPF